MNTRTQDHGALAGGHAIARLSVAVAIALGIYLGLVVGTQWTLFEAPQLPEAVAVSSIAPQHGFAGIGAEPAPLLAADLRR